VLLFFPLFRARVSGREGILVTRVKNLARENKKNKSTKLATTHLYAPMEP
jgi:hypothetical protein